MCYLVLYLARLLLFAFETHHIALSCILVRYRHVVHVAALGICCAEKQLHALCFSFSVLSAIWMCRV